jgi:hypothetical protein
MEKNDDVWFFDSGCSNHMTGDETRFFKLDSAVTAQIVIGNCAVVKSKGKCTIAINFKNGRILIHDALLMSGLT